MCIDDGEVPGLSFVAPQHVEVRKRVRIQEERPARREENLRLNCWWKPREDGILKGREGPGGVRHCKDLTLPNLLLLMWRFPDYKFSVISISIWEVGELNASSNLDPDCHC